MESKQITHADLAAMEAKWSQAIAEEDRQHRHYLMFELGRTEMSRLLAAYRELQDQHDALLLALQLTRDKARLGGHIDA
jgi:hypothetical protein